MADLNEIRIPKVRLQIFESDKCTEESDLELTIKLNEKKQCILKFKSNNFCISKIFMYFKIREYIFIYIYIFRRL